MRTITEIFLDEIPEIREKYYKYYKAELHDNAGQYVIWGVVLQPCIMELISDFDNNRDTLKRVFNFFEKMVTSNEEEIKEILMYSVLETLGDNPDVLIRVIPLMGKNTRQLTQEIENFLGRNCNLRYFSNID